MAKSLEGWLTADQLVLYARWFTITNRRPKKKQAPSDLPQFAYVSFRGIIPLCSCASW